MLQIENHGALRVLIMETRTVRRRLPVPANRFGASRDNRRNPEPSHRLDVTRFGDCENEARQDVAGFEPAPASIRHSSCMWPSPKFGPTTIGAEVLALAHVVFFLVVSS